MGIDLLHILPLYAPGGRRVAVSRDHYGFPLVSNIPYPPIEVATAAGLVRSRGFQVSILAADVLGLPLDEVVKRARALEPAHIHLPTTYPSFEEDCRLLGALRASLPHTRLLLTGPNVGPQLERVLAPGGGRGVTSGRSAGGAPEPGRAGHPVSAGTSLADEAILGEIEPGLLDAMLEPDGRGRANRAVWDGGAGAVVVGPRVTAGDLSYLEVPARDLLPAGGYQLPFAVDSPSTYLESSRGCSYGCVFCVPARIFYQDRLRFRPMALLMEDLEAVARAGYRDVAFKDLTFTVSRKRVVEVCERILERGYRFGWRCMSTVDRVDPELLALMKRAGCYQICYGFEAGNDAVLTGTGKGTTVEQGRKAARMTAKAGIEVAGTFILGLAGDSDATMEQTIRFALEEPVALAQFAPCVPAPGTPLARTLGIADDAPAPGGDLFHAEHNGAGMAPDALAGWVRRANRRFYLRPRIVRERLLSVRSWAQLRVQISAGVQVVARIAGG